MINSSIYANGSRNGEGYCLRRVAEKGEIIAAALGVIFLIGGIVFLWVGSLTSPTSLTWFDFVGYSFCALSVVSFCSIVGISKCRDRCIVGARTPVRNDVVNNEPVLNPPPNPSLPRAFRANYHVGYSLVEGQITIQIEKRELKERPVEHLQAFAAIVEDHIQLEERPQMRVEFNNQLARDGGGVTREYLDDLISRLTSRRNLFKEVDTTSLAVPNSIHEADLEVFKNLGELMMYCYPSLPIGFHIDPSVLAVALDYTANEINSDFARLSFGRKFELYRILLAAQQDQAHQITMALLSSAHWTNEQLIEVVEILEVADALPEEVRVTPRELIERDIDGSEIWDTQRVRRVKAAFYGDEIRRRQVREALTGIRELPNPPEGTRALLQFPGWRREQFQQAAHIVFVGTHNLEDLSLFFDGNFPSQNEIWETEEVRSVKPSFREEFTEQRIRELLARLIREFDPREGGGSLKETVEGLLKEEWGDDEFQEAVEIIFDRVNVKFQERSQFQPQLRGALTRVLETYLDPQLRGIQAIAKGMKSICKKGGNFDQNTRDIHWDRTIRRITVNAFNSRLQGSLNRNLIVSRIDDSTEDEVIGQKVRWLKEWIEDERTTKEEIMQLMKFITGSSSLPSGATIQIDRRDREVVLIGRRPPLYVHSPFPKTHTCANKIDIASDYVPHVERSEGVEGQQGDDTKEHFIEALKYAIEFNREDMNNY